MSKAEIRARLETSAVWRYGLPVVSVAAALAVTYLLQPYVFRSPLFFLAIMVSTWVGGRGPGLLAVLLSTLSISGFFSSQGILKISFENITNEAAFLLTSLIVGAWTAGRRRVEHDLRQARVELETRVQARTADLSRSNEQLRKEVAERERAEEAVRRSEDRIRLIIDTIPIMAWSVRPDGVVDFLNRRWTEYTGLSLEQYVADPAGPIHHQDRQRVFEKFRAQIVRGEAYNDEMRLRRADGKYCWFMVRTSPFRDEQGSTVKWYGVAIDIGGRKRAEEALKESRRRLEEAQGIAHVGHYEHDLDTGVVRMSDENYRILGLQPQETITLSRAFEFIHPDDRERVHQVRKEAVMTGRHFKVEYRAVRPDGQVRFIHNQGDVIRDEQGRPLRTFGIMQDITERKRSDEALRESQRKLEAAQRIAHIGHWERDFDTDLLTWSDEIYRIFGLPPQDKGLSLTEWQHMLHPEDRERVSLLFEEAQRGVRRYDVEYRIVRPDGEVRYVHSLGDTVRDEPGRPRRAFGVAQDITERKRAEEERKQLMGQLLSAQEDERLRISRELHDHLGQYLAALMMSIKSIDKADGLTPDLRERIVTLQNLTTRFSEEARRFAHELRPTVLDDIGLEAALSNYMEEWSKLSDIEIDYQSTGLAGRRLPALVETTLYRIIQEGLNNVLKHSRAHHVSVIIDCRARCVVAVLEDDGVGFDVASTLGAPASALGLGLVNMRERVRSVGGRLEIESVPGGGTTTVVRIDLPPGGQSPDEP